MISALADGGRGRVHKGETSKGHSLWYYVRVTRQELPWAFRDDGQNFRHIAMLEALGVLLSLMAFGPLTGQSRCTANFDPADVYRQPVEWFLTLNKLMTTIFPLRAVVMEMGAQMDGSGTRLELRWVPRDRNVEADAPSNGNFQGFSEILRVLSEIDESEIDGAGQHDCLR